MDTEFHSHLSVGRCILLLSSVEIDTGGLTGLVPHPYISTSPSKRQHGRFFIGGDKKQC